MAKNYDFAGWASRNNIKCTDGRTIQQGAFKDMDGKRVPLVYMHNHKDIDAVIGHCDLTYRPEGLWANASLNRTESADRAREIIQHGDIAALSIYANELRENNGRVYHGVVKEVSLVLAGANAGATIEYPVIEHADGSLSQDFEACEAIISMDSNTEHLYFGGEEMDELSHADKEDSGKEEKKVAESKQKSLEDVLNSLPEADRDIVYAAFSYAVENAADLKKQINSGDDEDDEEDEGGEAEHFDEEGDYDMKFNVFDNEAMTGSELSHADFLAIQQGTFEDPKYYGTLKESFLAHAAEYGIESIDYLFPEAKQINGSTPEFINYDQEWVNVVMKGVKHSPISRIKSVYADITQDDARAKGYTKGNRKLEEVFGLLRRATTPTTIYKKQKLDKDDIHDITDFDVVAWVKGEMRIKLNEEIARAILFSDGRSNLSPDKISEEHVRPIIKEDDLFCIKKTVTAGADDVETTKNIIRTAIKAQDDYEGSGNLTMFMPKSLLSDMLLLEDGFGHDLYESKDKLATKMLVDKIVTVPKEVWPAGYYALILNLGDYTVGADKGGSVGMFEDFDIDYNQEKYLMETRCSGALTKPYSAIVLKQAQ